MPDGCPECRVRVRNSDGVVWVRHGFFEVRAQVVDGDDPLHPYDTLDAIGRYYAHYLRGVLESGGGAHG